MRHSLTVCLAVSASGSAVAQPLVDPADMLHLLISQNGQSLKLEFETPVFEPVSLARTGASYSGLGSVLNGRGFNSQYGWLASGFFNLPFGSAVFVEADRVDRGLAFHDAFTFDPILTTSGSDPAWRWSGQMTHNWVSAARPGVYGADLTVYVGDASTGAPLAGWTGASVTLEWELGFDSIGPFAELAANEIGPVPAPGVATLLAMGLVPLSRRHR
ncbi:MAG: hypothetical protein AAFZ67_00210 [Planctomycetota bacterium]